MVYITLYGGVGEIGGNIVLLQDLNNRASILLDFGRNFPTQARYYSFPQKPRSSVQLELIKTGLIPSIRDADGSKVDVYAELETKEILRPYKAKGHKAKNLKRSEVYYTIREPQTPCSISDLFVTHCHSDHVGLAPILRRDVTINMGDATHLLYRAYHQAAAKDSIETKLYLTEEDLNARERTNQPRHDYRTFHSGTEIATGNGDITVVPHSVDHSAPGAYGFIIHSSSGLIVYTGDFRTHGTAKILTESFVERVMHEGKVRALICEGTNLGEAKVFSEEDVKKSARNIVEQSLTQKNRLVVVEVPQVDIDRVRTFCEVAYELDLHPLVSKKLANYLHELSPIKETFGIPGKPLPALGKNLGIYVEKRHPSQRDKVFFKLEQSYGDFIVDRKALCERLSSERFLIMDANEIDFFTLNPKPRTLCILSTCEPFNEEADFDFERWKNQLSLFGVILYHIHASGHCHPLELQRIISLLEPEVLIPIHTEYPHAFRELFQSESIHVEVPQKGVPIEV